MPQALREPVGYEHPVLSDRGRRLREGQCRKPNLLDYDRHFVVFAGELSQLLLGMHDPLLIDCAIVGLWAFTNLEMAYAQLRVDERVLTAGSTSRAPKR